jgi:hypothetical protein
MIEGLQVAITFFRSQDKADSHLYTSDVWLSLFLQERQERAVDVVTGFGIVRRGSGHKPPRACLGQNPYMKGDVPRMCVVVNDTLCAGKSKRGREGNQKPHTARLRIKVFTAVHSDSDEKIIRMPRADAAGCVHR